MKHSCKSAPDRTSLGIAIILASVFAMAFGDAVIKSLSNDLVLWQIFIARSLFSLPPLLIVSALYGKRALCDLIRSKACKWILLRSILLVLSWLSFYTALTNLDLSTAAVAAYTNPVMIVILSVIFLGARITWQQWIGVLLGFTGILVIMTPESGSLNWYILLPLNAAALYAISMIITRAKGQEVDALSYAIGMHVIFIVIGAAGLFAIHLLNLPDSLVSDHKFLLAPWTPMSGQDWGIMALLGFLGAGFSFGIAKAYQIAPPQKLATFDYAYLIAAAFWGAVILAEVPGLRTCIGMGLVIFAGLLTLERHGFTRDRTRI